MASKKVNKNKKPIIGNIESIIPKNLKFNKINPGSVIEDTKNKIGSIYTNFKKEREKEKKRLEKKRKQDEKKEILKEKKQEQKEK